VSGPHGFAVRNKRRSSCAPSFAHEKIALRTTCRADAAASTASPPAFVTIAKRPFPGRDVASDSADLPDGLSGIFFAKGLDIDAFERVVLICPSGSRHSRVG